MKKEVIILRFPAAVKKRLQKEAKKKGLTLNQWILTLLEMKENK